MNDTVSEDGLKAARAEANALLVQPDFADTIVRAYLAATKPPLAGEGLLPCDVHLPPATVLRKGVKLSTLHLALRVRGMVESVPVEQGVDAAWQELIEKDDRTSPAEYPDMALITKDELSRFIAASAVRSEPVAWIKTHPKDNRRRVDLHDDLDPWMIDEGGWSVTPLWPVATSPVQTREDGALRRLIRNLPSIIEDHVCGGSDTRPVVDIDGLVGALTENVAALLSQPEPKGDKT